MQQLKLYTAQFFKNTDGKVVIWQTPNILLISWAIAFALTYAPFPKNWHTFFAWIAFGLLFTWSWLEITKGSSWFRRTLGVVVLAGLIYSHLS